MSSVEFQSPIDNRTALFEQLQRPLGVDLPSNFRVMSRILHEFHQMTQLDVGFLNQAVEAVAVGERLEFSHLSSVDQHLIREFSAREQIEEADRLILVANNAIGDNIYNILPTVHMLHLFFLAHPEQKKKLTIYIQHPDLVAGFPEVYDFVEVVPMPRPYYGYQSLEPRHIPDLSQEIAEGEKVFIFSGLAHDKEKVHLLQSRLSRWNEIIGMAHIDIGQYTDFLPPYNGIITGASRLARQMELLLNERLIDDPTDVDKLLFPIPQAILDARSQLMQELGLRAGANIHILIDTGSTLMKRWTDEQIVDFLTEMVRYGEELDDNGQPRDTQAQIIFIEDPVKALTPEGQILRDKITTISSSRIKIVRFPSLSGLMTLYALSDADAPIMTITGADSGPTHLANAMGVYSLSVFTIANPFVWTLDRDTTKVVATDAAIELGDPRIGVYINIAPLGWTRNELSLSTRRQRQELIKAYTKGGIPLEVAQNMSLPQPMEAVDIQEIIPTWGQMVEEAHERRNNGEARR